MELDEFDCDSQQQVSTVNVSQESHWPTLSHGTGTSEAWSLKSVCLVVWRLISGVSTIVAVRATVGTSSTTVTVRDGFCRETQVQKSKESVGDTPPVWQGISTQFMAKLSAPVMVMPPPVAGMVCMQQRKEQVREPFFAVPRKMMVAPKTHGPGTCAMKKWPPFVQVVMQRSSGRQRQRGAGGWMQGHLVMSAIMPERSAWYWPFTS